MCLLLRKGWFYQSIPGSRKYSIMNALGHVDNDTLCSGATMPMHIHFQVFLRSFAICRIPVSNAILVLSVASLTK
jgi:hypothetical protein